MFKPRSSPQILSVIKRFSASIILVAAALLLVQVFDEGPYPTLIFVAAVAASAWYGGLRPGLMAAILAALALDYLFSNPLHNLERGFDGTARMSLFVLIALLSSWIGASHEPAQGGRGHMLVRAEEAGKVAGLSNFTSHEFLAMMTHELRTPLTCILGWVRMLREGRLDATSSVSALESIERSAERLELLIDDLLDVSRISSGKFRIEARRIDLATVITDTIRVVDIAARAKGIRIDTDYDGPPSFVMGDPERLQQVLWNLLTNAIKFTPERGLIKIQLKRFDSFTQISVSDTGAGISPDFLPHLFERFRQENNSTAKRQSGLGLGLAIVHHLVEMHGGTIRAESRGEGQGTAFIIQMPLLESQDSRSFENIMTDEKRPEKAFSAV
ncbi:MAG TPA: ATP-binding protein [Pyrinomonadaceae bacterium]|jgi:signal transduction histidine kinase